MVIRVVVAEDSLLVREGIVKLLGAYDDVVIEALCTDLPELLAAVEQSEPHVVLTDIRMPPTRVALVGQIPVCRPSTLLWQPPNHRVPSRVV